MNKSILLLCFFILSQLPQKTFADAICLAEDRFKSSKEMAARFHSNSEFGRTTIYNETFKNKDIDILKTGNVNFLKGGWDGLRIKNSEFTRAYFNEFKFQDVALAHVDLRGSHFLKTTLNNVQFKDVDARGIQVDSVVFDGVRWDGVKLKGASIVFTKFKDSKFENVDWDHVVLIGTTFENCTGGPRSPVSSRQAQK